ncbi:MAG: hypothetical protein K2M95_02730, partial [Clostridiales bacterium]|nr:hypothetical protein [Clostridiales bacterium]
MRWHIKRTKLLLALIPIISIVFYLLTANHNLYADQSFAAFDIYSSICDIADKEAGKDSPKDYSAAENFAIAAGVFLRTDKAQSTTTGTITAMGFYKQNVVNFRAIDGSHLFAESVSLSAIASVAEQKYFKDGAILYKKGYTKGSTVTGWPTDITELDPVVYRKRYGVVPRDICKYSVTKQSVQSGQLLSMGDGTYTFELVLDPEEAQKYGRYEMSTFAGTASFPEFLSCRIVYTIDSDWKILKIDGYDVYNIDIMGGIKATSVLNEVFTYEENGMPERAQPFIDYVPTGIGSGVETEKGPADYLSEAFGPYISGTKSLALTADITVFAETLPVTGLIDIANADYRFAVGDLFAVYRRDKLYLSAGENKLMLDTAALTSLLGGGGNHSASGGESPLSGDILGALFAEHEIKITDESVHILMPFNLLGIGFDVDMGLKRHADDTVTADTIDATLTFGGVQVIVAAKITDSVSLPAFKANEYTSLSPLLQAVRNTTAVPALRIDGE